MIKGGRRGFPRDVSQDILSLQVYYARLYPSLIGRRTFVLWPGTGRGLQLDDSRLVRTKASQLGDLVS